MYKKRECKRFTIPGTTLVYKKIPGLWWGKKTYSDSVHPVLDLSRGGLKFLSQTKIKAGSRIFVRLDIPGSKEPVEFKAIIRWISRNPEASYKYQNGVAFYAYGSGKNENPPELLSFLKQLESIHLM